MKIKRRAFIADRTYRRLIDIDIERDIIDCGFKLIILDIDGTLKNRFLRCAPKDVVEWVKQCRKHGLYVCLVSNDRRNRHIDFADRMDLPLVAAAHKPSPKPFAYLTVEYGVSPYRTVVIGNNPFTDILGAHRAGMKGYLVRSIETTRGKPKRRKRC